MLVLGRKKSEVILIGDDIRVTILRISGAVVRVGVEAPKGLDIVREELKLHQSGETKPASP